MTFLKNKIQFFVLSLIAISGLLFLSPLSQAAENPPKKFLVKYDDQKFLNWRMRLLDKISDKERQNILFAVSEYFFSEKDYSDAQRTLREFISKSPVNISTLLANVYLYKIAKFYGHEAELSAITKDLFQDRFVLLFDKFKKIDYTSPWKNKYEVRYFRDHIEVFLNGELFEEIKP